MSALLDDGIKWHVAGNSPVSGDFDGKQELFGHFQKLGELTKGSRHFDIHAILADDEHAVVLVDATLEHPSGYRGNEVHVWHLRDGLATECWDLFENQAAFDAAFNA